MIAERTVMLAVSDGTALEARCALPATPSGGIVLGHPHPLYGGDMDNPVVVRLAEVSQDLGLATLRFNFRGVGRSTGTHGGGRHEERDLEAALTHLRAAMDGPAPLLLAGYSFGATVAARVVAGRGPGADVAGVALIAPPIGLVGEGAFLALADRETPLLIVAGDGDQYCPAAALDALRDRLPRAAVTVIEGANHFFFGKLFPLGEAVADWIRRLEAGQPSRRGSAG